jgi:hypothetical protein
MEIRNAEVDVESQSLVESYKVSVFEKILRAISPFSTRIFASSICGKIGLVTEFRVGER